MESRAWGQLSEKTTEATRARLLDESAARDGFFGEVVALAMKLMVEARVLGATQIMGSEVNCIRFVVPLRSGDRLRTLAIVICKRRSKTARPGYLTLTLTTR